MGSKYRLFSADSHLEISPARWTPRVPAEFRDRAPRLIKLPNGGDGIVVENQPVYVLGLAVAGRPYEEHQLTGLNYETSAGAGSAEQRLQEQAGDGVDGEVLFTSAGNLSFWRGIRNDDAYRVRGMFKSIAAVQKRSSSRVGKSFPLGKVFSATPFRPALAQYSISAAVLHAYNEFLAEEYCAVSRDRLIAMGVIPSVSVEAAVGDPIRVMTRFGGNSGLNAVQLLLSGVFDRLPKLRIYWAETQVGWLPYFYEQLDDTYKRSRHWMARYFGIEPLKREPSAYIREHCYWGFIYDPIGLRLRYEVGVDKIMWGSDFPHAAGDWPHSRRTIEDMFSGVPDDERNRMLVGNAIEYFHLQ